jgi:hypothetical protein
MAIKDYNTAVSDGDIWVWSPNSVASSVRFNMNTKFVVDNMIELQSVLAAGINSNNTAIAENLTVINNLVVDVNKNLSAIDTKISVESFNNAVQALNDSISQINSAIASLDDTYQTDTEAATTISAVNDAWLEADSSLITALSALINDRYTKAETDAKLALKANISNVYSKTETSNMLANKLDKSGGVVSGSLIPSLPNTFTLGTAENPWQDVYVGPHSLYIDGQQAFTSEAGTITISADMDQNVQLKTNGSGDIEFYPSGNGAIQMKGSVQIPSNKFLMTNDNMPLQIAVDTVIDGDVTADNLYNKGEVDGYINTVTNNKADKSDTYTKNEVDGKVSASAYGIKYSWANESEKNSTTGVIALEQGVQQYNSTVYK